MITIARSYIFVAYSTGNTVHVNTTLYIENMNNSIINPINVRDGYYYYFVNPYTEYKL